MSKKCKDVGAKIKKAQAELDSERRKNSCVERDKSDGVQYKSEKCVDLENTLSDLYNDRDRVLRCGK